LNNENLKFYGSKKKFGEYDESRKGTLEFYEFSG
jgi:hypothetical protein